MRQVFAIVAILALAGVAMAESLPSSKAAAKINKVVALYSSCEAEATGPAVDLCGDDTDWQTIQTLYIKTPNQKDLAVDTAFECGLTTFTEIQSKNGAGAIDLSFGRIKVRVKITDINTGEVTYAEPDGLLVDEGKREGVVYCSRLQVMYGRFGGYNCTADLVTGVVTCEDPELLGLLLRTLEASAFNFIAADVPPGIKKIEVQARAVTVDAAAAELGASGKAFSEAFIGLGSTLVETVRLIKGAEIIEVE